jgi:hypothetical protein
VPSGQLEPAPRRASNRLIAGFDYPQNRVFRVSQFGLTMRVEAAGIEPAEGSGRASAAAGHSCTRNCRASGSLRTSKYAVC